MPIFASVMKALYVSSSLSYRVCTLLNSLISRKLRSTTFLLLYNFLLYFQGFLRLLFGGTTGRMPHFFTFLRKPSPSYALSISKDFLAHIAFGSSSNNFCPSGSSAADPGERRRLIGNLTSATTKWSFVVQPPRLLPMDCGPFFWTHHVHSDEP